MAEFDLFLSEINKTFSDCDDYSLREGGGGEARFALAFLKTVASRDYISETLLKPLLKRDLSGFGGDFQNLLGASSVEALSSPSEAASAIACGDCLLLVENKNGFFAVCAGTQTGKGRSVTEPASDVTVHGPKAGFVEDAATNLALIRKYIKSPSFKAVRFTVGEVSRTPVFVCFVEGRASAKLVLDIKNRVASLKASVITDSYNLAMLLEGRRDRVLPGCGSTEKVDKAAAKLMAGRIALIVDGSPFVLTLPYVFAESLQASDDYIHTPFYATFIRLLRLTAFLASVFAPGLLCALVSYDHADLPSGLYGLIDKSREGVPVSFFWEILAVLILFELLREVGVRMPRPVGDAVGIVGSIILGNTAVDAGIVSSVGVITVAFACVCAFITPTYMYVIVLFRIAVLILAELFGVFGLGLSASLLFVLFSVRESFGVPYLFPFSPTDLPGLQDFVFAWPKKTLGRRERLGDGR